jgi:hypothetical protein
VIMMAFSSSHIKVTSIVSGVCDCVSIELRDDSAKACC